MLICKIMNYLFKSIWNGKTLLRTLMNRRCSSVDLSGKIVLDLGSGSKKGSYHDFFQRKAKEVMTVDIKEGDKNHVSVNFETDDLPFEDGKFDTCLSFNLFEHIFNYQRLVSETYRVIKSGGELIGFVPFLVNYHPDPHDYFRYTEESLGIIFKNAGFKEISIEKIGKGPFYVNYNNIVLSIPRILRVVILPLPLILDYCFLKLRPAAKKRYPLGYFFTAKK